VPVTFVWRDPCTNTELEALHSDAFNHAPTDDDWNARLTRLSLGWITARDDDGLVGFVNVIWDGLVHAFILDTAVATRSQHQGIGAQLIAVARSHAAEAGCEWLHVDFDDDLRAFYFDACGFTPTNAGLKHL
jgi:GNAT superfamily N-acetyltransferase